MSNQHLYALELTQIDGRTFLNIYGGRMELKSYMLSCSMTGGAVLDIETVKGGKSTIKADNALFHATLTVTAPDASGANADEPSDPEADKPVFCEGCGYWIPGEGCGILYNIKTGRLGKYPGDAVKRGFCSDFEREREREDGKEVSV